MISHDPRHRGRVPAVYHDGLVPSPSLHLVHLFNDISDGSKVGTHPIR